MTTKASLSERLTVILFGVFLLTPGVAMYLKVETPLGVEELRTLSPYPDPPTTGKALQEWPGRFDDFFSDHFGFRRELVALFNGVSMDVFRHSPSDQVIVGKDGWLFYGTEAERSSYQRTNPWSEEDLNYIRKTATELYEWSTLHDVDVLFVLIPNKSTVYADRMPGYYKRASTPSRLEQIRDELRRAGIQVLDLSPHLMALREEGETYYPTDSHWNHRGQLLGVHELLLAIQQKWPDVALPPHPSSLQYTQTPHRGDLTVLLGHPWFSPKPTATYSGQVAALPFETLQQDQPRGIGAQSHFIAHAPNTPAVKLYHDSFGETLIEPFLAGRFSSLRTKWSHQMNLRTERTEGTDLVVMMLVERMFLEVPLTHFLNLNQLLWQKNRLRAGTSFHKTTGHNLKQEPSPFGTLRRSTSEDPEGLLLFGIYHPYPEGTHTIQVHLSARSETASPVGKVDIVARKGDIVLAESPIRASDTGQEDEVPPVTLSFEVPPGGLKDVECRVHVDGTGTVDIFAVQYDTLP